MNKFLPFSLPEIGEEEINEVIDTMRSGWLTTGPKTRQFEQDFANYLGDGVEAIAVNSATSGLHLALEAVGVKAGDEVIVPTYTFTATAEVVRYLGANPVFVDSNPDTFCINVDLIEQAITDKTKAIMPVHFAGMSAQMNEIIAIAKKHNLKIIEDAAHAFPCKYQGKLIGTLDTDVTVFSFYANKTMTTGEGGMLGSKNPDIIKRAKVMRLHGFSRDAFDRYQSKVPAWFYEVIEPGFKYNMPDICAAVGLHQLKKIDTFQQRREELAKVYDEELQNLPIILPPRGNVDEGNQHAWHLYPIRLTENCKISRDEFIEEMAKRNIGCSVHFIPLHRHPVWRDTYQLKNEMFPVAEKQFLNVVSIPLFTKMTDEDQQYVITQIKEVLA
ncbi:DegT/DnrJ/EryC1/StrS family aminotransferase [Pasteurella atlantica]|uniref:DegT/DnrJ/EryC1/StrS family aminotransferase n=1 Tax=Pasteurellaceae TaxID=712 RepID=UPI00275AE38B|nr:DegT/DnrJ/EryC1/StrS aminotransferase family protein [Pasteurella atlantica]MDP8098742.1 DegT/DnrJ/EryC1/StrS aminotransferase family protein [Pasteurella atlantica]MDP8106854.1 DegT/DnrJ/EryC1/StrS aminotransferase family protein [Pasteurella atlantica]MDP8116544.1 DegT/DnrJ/EryC1/StrS aminotransferase family protein [Pasteurella atlantica]